MNLFTATRNALVLIAILMAASCSGTHSSRPRVVISSLPEKLSPGWISGAGFLTDATHPKHPGDFQRIEIGVSIGVNRRTPEAALEVSSGEDQTRDTDRYFLRDGRIFQQNDQAAEAWAMPLGDLSAATVAALHPDLVSCAMRARPENVHGASGEQVFAWNGVLWEVSLNSNGTVAELERATTSDVLGDGVERIRYEGFSGLLGNVVIESGGREIARVEYSKTGPGEVVVPKSAEGVQESARLRQSVTFEEVGTGLFKVDIEELNSRVFVVEFADHVAVIEGAYSSRVCDELADEIRKKFAKPVRYFAFSHLHGQYIGGVRSWVAEGATVLVPPTTAELVTQIVEAPFALRPDRLTAAPKPLKMEAIPRKLVLSDEANTLEIYNVESQHTDEYFIFYLPKAKVVLTGDLLFYRPGAKLSGRSLKLAQTVKDLGLDVERYIPTWPLVGFGTKSMVSRSEVEEAMRP